MSEAAVWWPTLALGVWTAVNFVVLWFVVEIARGVLRNARINEQFAKVNADNAESYYGFVVRLIDYLECARSAEEPPPAATTSPPVS